MNTMFPTPDEAAIRKAYLVSLQRRFFFLATGVGLLAIALVLIFLLIEPIFGPWKQERQGMANLRQATQERQILVERARGELMAAEAQAQAIITMGQAAKDNPEYRLQSFMSMYAEALEKGRITRVIYVPVEAPLPLTEARN